MGGGRVGYGLNFTRLFQLDWNGGRNTYAWISDVWHGTDTQAY